MYIKIKSNPFIFKLYYFIYLLKMTDSNIQEEFQNNSEEENTNEETSNEENSNETKQVEETKPVEAKTKRSDKTKAELTKQAKDRAIENFNRGIADPEYKVVKMTNGKFRCYKRKESLPPEPIKLNQIPENKPSDEQVENVNVEIIEEKDESSKSKKKKDKKEHDPFKDIVYFNMSNQISEQLNKRLDAVNAELDKLKHKNSKLKGKYKALKQAIYITDEEEDIVDNQSEQHESEPVQQVPQVQQIPQAARSNRGINFNRFFQ